MTNKEARAFRTCYWARTVLGSYWFEGYGFIPIIAQPRVRSKAWEMKTTRNMHLIVQSTQAGYGYWPDETADMGDLEQDFIKQVEEFNRSLSKCECGAEATNSIMHSTWCPKHDLP